MKLKPILFHSPLLLALFLLSFTACNNQVEPVAEDGPQLAAQSDFSPPYDDIVFDYHEDYGTIGIEDYPAGTPNDDIYDKLAPLLQGETILSITVTESDFTGPGMTEHLINGQTIWVWHEFVNTAIVVANISYMDQGDVVDEIISVRKRCYNWLGGWLAPIGKLLRKKKK